MKDKRLKAYLISYTYVKYAIDFKEGRGSVENIVVIAHHKEEALKKLKDHLLINLQYKEKNLHITSVQRLRKTKNNSRFFTEDYYNKQEYVIYHFDDFIKERGQ